MGRNVFSIWVSMSIHFTDGSMATLLVTATAPIEKRTQRSAASFWCLQSTVPFIAFAPDHADSPLRERALEDGARTATRANVVDLSKLICAAAYGSGQRTLQPSRREKRRRDVAVVKAGADRPASGAKRVQSAMPGIMVRGAEVSVHRLLQDVPPRGTGMEH